MSVRRAEARPEGVDAAVAGEEASLDDAPEERGGTVEDFGLAVSLTLAFERVNSVFI